MPLQLRTDQLSKLHQALLARYPAQANLDDMLLTQLGRYFQHYAVQGSNYSQNMLAIIKAAQAESWLPELVQQARRDDPSSQDLKALESELARLGPPQGVDCLEVCCLTASRVMIDRKDLRDSLKELNEPRGRRIMVVTGRKRSGKSHSVQLISYLTAVRGGFSLVPIDLGEWGRVLGPDTPVEPYDIASALVTKLGYDFTPDAPPTDMQWSRWVLNFCERFEAHALRDAARYCWVVIDGFGSVVLPQPTLDLIKGLAVRVNGSLTQFRLILLGYGDDFPPDVLRFVIQECIGPIGVGELSEFFGRAYEQLQIPATEDELAEAVTRVLEGLDLGHEDFLFDLEPRVSDALAEAAGQGGGS